MKGILFQQWKSKAISESSPEREWQTRRLGRLKEINKEIEKWAFRKWEYPLTQKLSNLAGFFQREDGKQKVVKPHYKVSEVVYIKEAWAVGEQWDNKKPSEIDPLTAVWYPTENNVKPLWVGRLRSPLFLPEKFARYFIKIKAVRVERLQEITEVDASREGFNYWEYDNPDAYADCPCLNQFILFWNKTNPKYPFSSNPFVFVYSFVKETE